jgi:hypothetical protein
MYHVITNGTHDRHIYCIGVLKNSSGESKHAAHSVPLIFIHIHIDKYSILYMHSSHEIFSSHHIRHAGRASTIVKRKEEEMQILPRFVLTEMRVCDDCLQIVEVE